MRAALTLLLAAMAGCFAPNPKDKGWTCSLADNGLCPSGLSCDYSLGLCVTTLAGDMGAKDINAPDSLLPTTRTCDERVRQGAFSSATNLAALNTAGNERGITLSANGQRIYFIDAAGGLSTATLATPKSAGTPEAVTITGAVGTLEGGSLTANGSYLFAMTNGGTTSLFVATSTTATSFAAGAAQLPTATCPFTDPVLLESDPADKQLYVSFPLDGCGGSPMIAQGRQNKQINAFYGALASRGFRSPSLLPGGLTMLLASTGAAPRLHYADRGGIDVQWSGPIQLPLGGIGAPSGELQAVVSPDCKTLYFVSTRSGGKGGSDVWAADIAAE